MELRSFGRGLTTRILTISMVITLPEPNIFAPENWWLEDYLLFASLEWPIFSGENVSFRECNEFTSTGMIPEVPDSTIPYSMAPSGPPGGVYRSSWRANPQAACLLREFRRHILGLEVACLSNRSLSAWFGPYWKKLQASIDTDLRTPLRSDIFWEVDEICVTSSRFNCWLFFMFAF